MRKRFQDGFRNVLASVGSRLGLVSGLDTKEIRRIYAEFQSQGEYQETFANAKDVGLITEVVEFLSTLDDRFSGLPSDYQAAFEKLKELAWLVEATDAMPDSRVKIVAIQFNHYTSTFTFGFDFDFQGRQAPVVVGNIKLEGYGALISHRSSGSGT